LQQNRKQEGDGSCFFRYNKTKIEGNGNFAKLPSPFLLQHCKADVAFFVVAKPKQKKATITCSCHLLSCNKAKKNQRKRRR